MATLNKFFLVFAILCVVACDDILEDDISDDMVLPIYPSSGTTIESNVVTFQWNQLKGADDYRVQVFSDGQQMVLDSLVTSTHATFEMNPGNYQWRVRGENSAYESAYSFPLQFEVIASDDLSNQQVLLSAPAPNFMTNSTTFSISWQPLSAADSYSIEIINLTNSGTLVHEQSGITANSLALDATILTQDAEYQWKVKAVNSLGETPFSARNFSLDTTAPNQPQLSLPEDEANIGLSQTVIFEWSIATDSGVIQSPVSYIIEISTNNSFTNIIQTSSTTQPSFQQLFTVEGTYYWRVKAKDGAGNIGTPGTYFEFTID